MRYFLKILLFVILFTSFSFTQWIPQNSNTTQRLLSVFFLNENLGWAAGNEGCIIKTTDGGSTWNYYSIGTKYTVHAITFVDSLNGWVALYSYDLGRAGYIMATTDGGINWELQCSVEGYTLHNVYFYDEYFGWATGSNGIFLRTVNGGNNWQVDFISPQWSWSLCFISPNEGWVGDGFSGYIRKTTDGGYSWQFKSVPTYSRMMDIQFINQNIGWAVGQYGHILKTTNAGETWTHQYSGVILELNKVKFVDENSGWVIGLGGVILHTTNGGSTWFPQGNPLNNDLYGLSSKSSQLGWIAGSNGIILKTENGGGEPLPVELISFTVNCNSNMVNLSWTTATELNNSGFDIELRNENSEWEKVSFIKGNGTTTETKYYFYSDYVKSISGFKLFYRLKQIDFDGTFKYSDEIEVALNLPDKFQLMQNFPNPFNPATVIKYQLPEKSFITLKLFDVLGKEVETLVSNELDAGSYQLEVNGSNLSSGIYFYTLQTESFSDTKKMILLK